METCPPNVYPVYISEFPLTEAGVLCAQAIGLVENQSDWYLGKIWKHHNPWPALVGKLASFTSL